MDYLWSGFSWRMKCSFFYSVTQSYVFHIQKMRKRPTRHEVHWNEVIRLPVSNVLSGLNFSSNLHLFRIHFSKIDCLHFKGEGGKLGDLICVLYVSYMCMCIVDVVAYWRLRIARDCKVCKRKSFNENGKLWQTFDVVGVFVIFAKYSARKLVLFTALLSWQLFWARCTLHSKRFRGVGEQRKTKERNRNGILPAWSSGESQNKKERGGGGEGRKHLRTNPWILKTSVPQQTELVSGWTSQT